METQAKKQKKLNLYADFKNDIKQHPDYFTAKEASTWENSWFSLCIQLSYEQCIGLSYTILCTCSRSFYRTYCSSRNQCFSFTHISTNFA